MHKTQLVWNILVYSNRKKKFSYGPFRDSKLHVCGRKTNGSTWNSKQGRHLKGDKVKEKVEYKIKEKSEK